MPCWRSASACGSAAGAAIAVWLALATIIRQFQWTLLAGLIVNAIAFAICVPLLRPLPHVKMPLIARRWYDIPLRAALVATLVATVVTTSSWVGPRSQRHHRAVSDRVHQP